MSLISKNFRRVRSRPTSWLVLAIGVMLLASSGCVQRRMTIRSNPPGAIVYVDDYELGQTPLSNTFIYYGQRKIRLVKDGYETLTVMEEIRPPWYQFVPFDFVSENLLPGKITDRRTLDYQLRPQLVVPPDQLIRRAEELRGKSHGSATQMIVPPGGPIPTPPGSSPTLPTTPGMPIPSPQPGMETIPAPGGVGGQPVYPLPPR